MKTKPKQKRGDLIESTTAFTVNEISKRDLGWIVRASNNGAWPESSIEISHEVKEQVFIQIPKSDFDRLQPGDQIRFLAVVTRPRKVKSHSKPMECVHGMRITPERVCYDCQPELKATFHKDSASTIAAEVAG